MRRIGEQVSPNSLGEMFSAIISLVLRRDLQHRLPPSPSQPVKETISLLAVYSVLATLTAPPFHGWLQ